MKRNLLWLAALAIFVGAGPYRPTPRFAGKTIPAPPRQRDPWTPPETKLPLFLVTATAALFDAGMGDPRGCEYREVEIGDATLVKTRGFVLPERPGDSGRFAVGWDGIVYPAASVGEAAGLEADARTITQQVRKERDEYLASGRPQYSGNFGFLGPDYRGRTFTIEGQPPKATPAQSTRTLAMLLRLGHGDLAEAVFAAGTIWTPVAPRRDLTNYHITFLSIAWEWGVTVYNRLMSAHARGDDAVALDAARRLSAFQKAVDARAEAMGFPRPAKRNGMPGTDPYIGPFGELDKLLADHERRAQEAPRGPIPKRGGDPSARIAALIRDFDQINAQQMSVPGSANPGGAPIVGELIAESDPAVEPLLAALETDTRLTRSITGDQGDEYVHPVTDAIFTALKEILHTYGFLEQGADSTAMQTPEGRRRLASAIRATWQKNRAIPLAERWYRTLRDDSAGTNAWLDAAVRITLARSSRPYSSDGWVEIPKLGQPLSLVGEPLRTRRDPSVTDLMARRVAEIARGSNPRDSPDVIRACVMAEALSRWDLAASLPSLRTLTAACRDGSKRVSKDHPTDPQYARYVARFTLIREHAGDHAALDEYAEWVKGVTPPVDGPPLDLLEPLWLNSRHPEMIAAARAMFTDPKSPWLPLVYRERIGAPAWIEDPIALPLVCLEPYREALIAALGEKDRVGTAILMKEGGMQLRRTSGRSGTVGEMRTPTPEDKPGVEVPIRACDIVARKLWGLEGAPECLLYWDEARRDKAVAACVDYLRRYGRNFSIEELPGEPDFPVARAHLRFSALGKPATAEDVRGARAIFSLEGESDARIVALLTSFPVRARWTTLKAFPIDRRLGAEPTHREYLQDGWVWQAEQVRKGDRWERFYGFVGHATIARVPASEIVFPLAPYLSSPLADSLDAQVSLVDRPPNGYAPGESIVMTMRLRNGLGVERTVPTEFVRPGDDGHPALRRGVTLALVEVRNDPYGSGIPARPPTPREPNRQARFDPGGASRTLGPTEAIEVMRLDLRDWFGTLAPGLYRVRINFAQDSGLGMGSSGDVFISVRNGEMP